MARTPRSTTPTRVVPTRVKQPGIVAELGRPETPEETAARKAENSRKHRANQTLRNLLWSLAASVALMLLLVVVVVRPEQPAPDPIDYITVAAQAQPGIEEPLALPALPPSWKANSAELGRATDGISTWYIGFITPSTEFVALSQGIGANPTWLATLLDKKQPTGTETIDGVEWEVYDHRDDEDPGNLAYAMVTEAGESTFVLYGTADSNEFRTLAASVDAEIAANAANADQGTSGVGNSTDQNSTDQDGTDQTGTDETSTDEDGGTTE